MSDTQFMLGKILEVDQGQRDAVHIAVAPVFAAETLEPGQRAGLLNDGRASVAADYIGIVDPFLTDSVHPGQRFWLYLFPNTITSLHHLWTHPAFEAEQAPVADKAASEAWLRSFIKGADCPGYDTVLAAATDGEVSVVDEVYGDAAYVNDGQFLHFNGRDAHSEIPDEFWDHVEIVSGKKIPRRKRAQSFSCSC